ncbi:MULTISPECIES: hypothetical protein [Oceanobacillus]|uniref:Uncharacterized protein n=1 Tax=Oceanobacillus kimchii TaxID=746691 RepID=A0ABQ5TQ04_9BACI|nr:hypothetical protein [Oceanobacillus kimchii]GLO68272.1 hypothetical protein MACH08_40560 [Oceanobacillus kimchii]
MGEISGKLLGILATIAVFVVAIMVAVYPTVQEQGVTVGDQVDQTTNEMPKASEIDWKN